jgi:hypothetical protein
VWADRVWAEARALIDDGRHPGKIIPYIPSGEIKVWDNIAGDYISGGARLFDAVVVAIALAAGAGSVMYIFGHMTGGVMG